MINVIRSGLATALIPFQINRDHATSTVEAIEQNERLELKRSVRDKKIAAMEVCLIFLLFAAVAGQAAPHVNESHYLTKAKHFWDPDWCPDDIFLTSNFTHWMFYVAFGWLTTFVSLETFAWIGRIGTWIAIALAWQRLSWRLNPIPFIAPLTALLFYLLNDRFHLAGEWVIGGFEAKGIAYALLIFGLVEMVASRWKRVWPLLGLAAAMHLLVGCWGLVAVTLVWLVDRRTDFQLKSRLAVTAPELAKDYWRGVREQWPQMLLGLSLVFLGAIPPLLADWQASCETSLAAREIYVNHRLKHHLTFGAFPVVNVARFTALICLWFVLQWWCWKSSKTFRQIFPRLIQFGFASMLISLTGLFLSGLSSETNYLSNVATGWLRFYWFRLSDFAIPATVALMTGWIISQWWSQSQEHARKFAAGFAVVMIVAAGVLLVIEKTSDSRPVADQRSLPRFPDQSFKNEQYYRKWKQVCEWIAVNTPADAHFITPFHQQTFKWYAQRSEVVNWKDIPQNAASILEWQDRVDQLILPQQRNELGLMSYSDEQLRDLARKYQARYLLVPQWQVELVAPTSLKRVYPEHDTVKAAFVVFEF